jgi:hypothetical protein
MFVECRSAFERHDIIIDTQSRRTETTTTMEITGRKIGLCGELGARLHIRPVKFLSLFAEGGFAFRQASGLKGNGTLRTEIQRPGAEPIVTSEKWNDRLWYLVDYGFYRSWGHLSGSKASNYYVDSYWPGTGSFYLDMSGFQLKAGIVIGL